MSSVEQVWGGGGSSRYEVDEYGMEEVAMTEHFIRDDSVFYDTPMRWNKNTKASREKECWDCHTVTGEYYQHLWRTQNGKIACVKCLECYEKYLKAKKND